MKMPLRYGSGHLWSSLYHLLQFRHNTSYTTSMANRQFMIFETLPFSLHDTLSLIQHGVQKHLKVSHFRYVSLKG